MSFLHRQLCFSTQLANCTSVWDLLLVPVIGTACTVIQRQLFPFFNYDSVSLSQVGMGSNKCLYALEDGIVRFTKEVYVPPARGQESREVICQLPKGAVLYKTFINIVPTEEVGSFKLITMIWELVLNDICLVLCSWEWNNIWSNYSISYRDMLLTHSSDVLLMKERLIVFFFPKHNCSAAAYFRGTTSS